MDGMGVPGREYIQGKPVVQKVFNEIKSEFVDAPAGVGYKCNTLFYGHRAANLPIVCFFSKMSVGEPVSKQLKDARASYLFFPGPSGEIGGLVVILGDAIPCKIGEIGFQIVIFSAGLVLKIADPSIVRRNHRYSACCVIQEFA